MKPNFSQNSLLVTAQVNVLNNLQRPIRCRALLDTGATTNLITQQLANQLGLTQRKCFFPIGVLDTMSTTSTRTITATIASTSSNYQKTLPFLIISNISSLAPDQPINRSSINIPRNIKLADPEFHRPASIDMLLNAGTTLSLLQVGQINLTPQNGPDLYLQKTLLGWVIGGSTSTSLPVSGIIHHSKGNLEADLTKFWEIEEVPHRQHLSESDRKCESHFIQNTVRSSDGRYVVALPFNERISLLDESRSQALRRLHSLERKLHRDPELMKDYHAVLQEYLSLGHLSEIETDPSSTDGYYLPHHGVLKVTSQTTKLRVVFDGSAKTTTGISLNDALHTGPKIQDDLLYILLRFRIHQYVLTGDIEKMYRQFLMRPEDRKFQRILWRGNDDKIKTFQLNTVTFGLSAAPYLAIRCLHQFAEDERHRFPNAAKILQRDFYVDDALTGATTKEEALALRKELTDILNSACLNVRQWASNDRELLEGLPEQDINQKLHLGESSTVKTLGVYWNSADDTILYAVRTSGASSRITKRSISSEIARIYDPLGLLAPVIIRAKMLLQKIWTLKLDWDESLPQSVHVEWERLYTQLPLLNNIAFQRKTVLQDAVTIELHGFSDASERAYGACVYLRSIDAFGNINIELLAAKSKVAPIKYQTIPRLELCGALLLTSLVKTIQQALHISINQTIFWTDSSIVLHWIRSSTHNLKTFVANRISEIQTRTNATDWRHVRTAHNPADLISRGLSPEEFLRPTIWQHGPQWLSRDQDQWPICKLAPIDVIPEQKQNICLTTTPVDVQILEKFSSWPKLIRVVARCLRWKRDNLTKGPLTPSEIRYAHNNIIRMIQALHFQDELKGLKREGIAVLKGKLLKLNPFIDQDGILRVGGRLKNSTMPFSQKHPIILPKAKITSIIIENEHRINLHTGTQATLHAIRRRYWPIDGRSQVWSFIKNCVRCCRANPPSTNYIMGNLPEARVTEARPFSNVGVDYCGHFYIKERRHRNRARIKVYVAVFVCLAVKAVHLELVSDLTTDAFLAALRRFIARRGHCRSLYSDNGTNFVGAKNELNELYKLLHSNEFNDKDQGFLSTRLIQWNFIPPQAPHFGGLWEAAVKAFKSHLKRVAGNELLSFENFSTLITEIESILNSRPLTPISSDPNDILALTPGHFLIGESLMSLPEQDIRDIPTNRLSSWRHVQKLKQHFWTRWHREYLNELTTRNKWAKGAHHIKEGTIVLLRDDNTPPMEWALGRVIKIHPGSDGIVRAATIKTATNVLDRPVKKLVPLPNQCSEESRPLKDT